MILRETGVMFFLGVRREMMRRRHDHLDNGGGLRRRKAGVSFEKLRAVSHIFRIGSHVSIRRTGYEYAVVPEYCRRDQIRMSRKMRQLAELGQQISDMRPIVITPGRIAVPSLERLPGVRVMSISDLAPVRGQNRRAHAGPPSLL